MASYRVMKQYLHSCEPDFDDDSLMLATFNILDDARAYMEEHLQESYRDSDFQSVSISNSGTVNETVEAVDWDGNVIRLWLEVRTRVVRRLFE